LTKANTRANDESTISSIGYTVNNLGQRTSATRSGAATNSTAWGYDALGQVISADDTNNTADRAYQYDTIGNRKKSAESLTLPSSGNYTTNPLNQYTNIGGSGGYNPTFDEDGNQRNAQIHPTASSTPLAALYEWDGENRLRSVKNSTGVILVEYHYDAQSRRIATIGRGDLPSLSSPEQTTLHLYDGWNCIAEYTTLDLQTFDLRHSYLWGPDLSGSMQGAGGVGGLLAVTQTPVTGAPVTYYPCFDGNGNITEYINASGAIVAHFGYDPFGNTPIITGAQAQEFKYRFSTKPLENTTGLYYYGYRYYHPQTGRWINKDPIEEEGGLNLYGFVENDGLNFVDVSGLFKWPWNKNTKNNKSSNNSQTNKHNTCVADPLSGSTTNTPATPAPECCCISKIIINFTAAQARVEYTPSKDGVYNNPTGRAFIGSIIFVCKSGKTWTGGSVITGGMFMQGSSVKGPTKDNPLGDDSASPSGNFNVDTFITGIGFHIKTPGTGRGSIKIHPTSAEGSHGCTSIRNSSEWEQIKKMMDHTKNTCGNSFVPVRVQYNNDIPIGNRGNHKNDPPLDPVALPL
jgi:RHS repeat-associated protein